MLFLFSLPLPIKRRVRALKNLQVDIYKLEAQFYEEIQQLEAKYQELYQPLLDKVREVISDLYQCVLFMDYVLCRMDLHNRQCVLYM